MENERPSNRELYNLFNWSHIINMIKISKPPRGGGTWDEEEKNANKLYRGNIGERRNG